MIPAPPGFDTLDDGGNPETADLANCLQPTNTTSLPTRKSRVGSITAQDALLRRALRKKDMRKIRQRSGVKPKVKLSRTCIPRSANPVPTPNETREMVQCQWEGCTKSLHVDYISVKHWGKHIRGHFADKQEMVQCKWDGGCGSVICKSSMWKHVVVHQPKFKIRCPRGCGIFTRADMMRRHLQTCSFIPRRAVADDGSDGKGGLGNGENMCVDDSDDNGKEDEGEKES